MHDNDDSKQYQIRFISSDPRLPRIPPTELSVPVNLATDALNELLSAQLAENEEWENTTVSFLINGKFLTGSLDEFVSSNDLNTELLIDIECVLSEPAPRPDKSIQDEDWIAAIKVSPSHIFSANYSGQVICWSHKGTKLDGHKFEDESLRCLDTFTFDGKRYLTVGGSSQTLNVLRFDESTVNKVSLVPAFAFRGHERSVECVSASKDGRRLVSGGFDKCIKVWGMDAPETDFTPKEDEASKPKKKRHQVTTRVPLTTVEGHRNAVMDIEFCPLDEGRFVSASWDQSLNLWDLESTAVVSTLTSNKAFQRLSLNRLNGVVVTASMDNVVRLWDFRSQEGGMVKQIFRGHNGIVSDVHWSPSGEFLFATASFDETVKMWDVRSSDAPLFEISGHKGHVLSVDWSYDGLIASGGKDSTLKTYRRD